MQFWINNELALRGELRQYAEPIDVTMTLPTMHPDPAWSAVDLGGHFHAFAADSKRIDP